MLGFVFYAASPRAARPGSVTRIVHAMREEFPHLRTVGVFVDEDPHRMCEIASNCGIDALQLHGNESPDLVHTLAATGFAVIKALRVREARDLAPAQEYAASGAYALLLDALVAGQPGGTGVTFDWSLARLASVETPVIVAGGLNADNVGEAIRIARPWGVDVSSGVERAPGLKDAKEIRRLVEVVRKAYREGEESADGSDG